MGSDHTLADAIAAKIKNKHYSPYAAWADFQTNGWLTATRLCAKTICSQRNGMDGHGSGPTPRRETAEY